MASGVLTPRRSPPGSFVRPRQHSHPKCRCPVQLAHLHSPLPLRVSSRSRQRLEMLSRWFSSLFQTKRPYKNQKRRNARLNLLPLEDRITPVAAFALSGSNLLSFDTASPAIVQ